MQRLPPVLYRQETAFGHRRTRGEVQGAREKSKRAGYETESEKAPRGKEINHDYALCTKTNRHGTEGQSAP